MWPVRSNSWRSTWWGPCWALYFVLPWDYVNNSDNLAMAVSSNNSKWVPLREHLIVFNETHIPNDEDVGVVGVKKKKIHKKK